MQCRQLRAEHRPWPGSLVPKQAGWNSTASLSAAPAAACLQSVRVKYMKQLPSEFTDAKESEMADEAGPQ